MNPKNLSRFGKSARAMFNQNEILNNAVKGTEPIQWENVDTNTRRQYRFMLWWQILNGVDTSGVELSDAYNALKKYRSEIVKVFNESSHVMAEFEHADVSILNSLKLQNEFVRHHFTRKDRMSFLLYLGPDLFSEIVPADEWDNVYLRKQVLSAYIECVIDLPFVTTSQPLSPEQIHARWCQRMTDNGWVIGATVNEKTKTHDMMTSYERLTELEKEMFQRFTS